MAIQPEIDRAFISHNTLEHYYAQTGEIFLNEEVLEQQSFSIIHNIVLRRIVQDLNVALAYYCPAVNSIDANGRTPLHWAAWRGDVEIVKTLIQHGADVDRTDYESFTALSRAAETGHLEIVQILLDANASISIATTWGHQPIHLASKKKLHGCQIVHALLVAGADPNAYSYRSETALHHAAKRGSVDTVNLLLSHSTNINAVDMDGDTAAMVALQCWNEDMFLYLVQAGAKLDVVNGCGINVLQLVVWAAGARTWDVIADIAEKGELGFVDTDVLHGDHDIKHCFGRCRDLSFVGEREKEEEDERKSLDRLIKSVRLGNEMYV